MMTDNNQIIINYEPILDFEILDFLPLEFNTPQQVEFIGYLIETFNNNWREVNDFELYQIAFKAFYDLYMVFIFVKIWQLKENKNSEFLELLNTYDKSDQKNLTRYKNINSPGSLFEISTLKDKKVFNLLKILNLHNNQIEDFTKYINIRNHCSHPSGFIQYRYENLEKYLQEIINYCISIQTKFYPLLIEIFKNFLINNFDLYGDPNIFNDTLVKPNFLSIVEIKYLCKFNIKLLEKHENYREISRFMNYFLEQYPYIL